MQGLIKVAGSLFAKQEKIADHKLADYALGRGRGEAGAAAQGRQDESHLGGLSPALETRFRNLEEQIAEDRRTAEEARWKAEKTGERLAAQVSAIFSLLQPGPR